MATVDRASVDPALKAVQTRKARYATFKVVDNNNQLLINTDKISERSVNYKDFLRDLKDNQPRFCIYDYEYLSNDQRPTSALYCIYWIPQNCNQQERILYSSGKSNFVTYLNGYKNFTCEDKDEVKEILEKEVAIKKD